MAECLRRLSFCDETVVVADRCTDRSQEIARRHGAMVIDGIFPLENQRKSAGMDACTGEWILEIDPDEVVDAALAWEIRAVLQMRPDGDHYQLPIDNYVGGERVREGWAGAFSTRAGVRLYRRGFKAWEPRRLNAPASMAGRSGGALKGAIRRTLGPDLGGVLERLNTMTALEAEDAADAGRLPGIVPGVFAGVGAFLTAYLFCGGWREGRLGLLMAMLSATYPVLVVLRAAEVTQARQAAIAKTEQPGPVRRVVGLPGR